MDNWDPFAAEPAIRGLGVIALADGAQLKRGDRVRLRPLGRGDVMDIALDGQIATIVAIEQDLEDRIHVAVTIDDDPGKDLGEQGKPGHRFFFAIDEVELVTDEPAPPALEERL